MDRVDLLRRVIQRRLARQRLVRRNALEEIDPPCEHVWAPVLQQVTWRGHMRLSRCSLCSAVLREWLDRGGR